MGQRDMVDGLAEKLSATRIAAGLSQVQASEKSTVSRTMINQFESNKKTPTLATLMKLADAYGVNVCALIPGGKLPKTKNPKRATDELR